MLKKIGEFFDIKTFALTLSFLVICLAAAVGGLLAFGGAQPTLPVALTGKVMASVKIEPPATAHDDAPPPEEHTAPVTEPPAPHSEDDHTDTPKTESPETAVQPAPDKDIEAPANPLHDDEKDSDPEVSPINKNGPPHTLPPPPPKIDLHDAAPLEPPAEDHDNQSHDAPHDAASPPKTSDLDAWFQESVDGLLEESTLGSLPIIRKSDGLKVLDAYKAPFKLNADTKSIIALVMVDYGLSDANSKLALEKFPAGFTFVATPYSTILQAKITGARKHGQEVWLSIPMQGAGNLSDFDSGPSSLLSGLDASQNILRLNTSLGSATGYAGLAFMTAPDFKEDSNELKAVMESLAKRGLGIVQMDTNDAVIAKAAHKVEIPFIHNQYWIDAPLQEDAIIKALTSLENASLQSGYAVAAFHPTKLTINIVSEWQKTLAAKHIQLAPLTYALHQQALTLGKGQK